MIERLTPVQRRILALALALVVVLAFARLVVLPTWGAYLDNRDAIAQHREDIARYSRLATRMPELEAALRDLERSDALARYVLTHESAALAAAALQERVKTVVQRSGGDLTSTQVLPAEEEGQGFRRVTVNVRMAVSTPSLQEVFYELESTLPYLLVDEVVILSRASRRRRAVAPGTDMLDVRFNLSGFMRGAAGGA